MKRMKPRLLFALLLLTLGLTSAFGQITPRQDSYTDTSKATTNFGAAPTLGVASSVASIQSTYIQFDLSSVPAGYTSANVAKATLKLFVNGVTKAGSLNVHFVDGSWSEKTIASSLAPVLGTSIASSVPVTTTNANDYILIDVTSAVGEWLNGSHANDGLALVADSELSVTFDSKENAAQSHPAELDIVFTGGGTISGVDTASGSGLTGGGTSGTLNLSLTKSCSSHQVLQWNGSAWTCASAGAGTISSVGLSAPASDFSVSGSPLTGSGTLNLSWNVAPTSANAGHAIVKRDASGNFAAGAVTATTVEAGGVETGSMFSSSALTNGSPLYALNTVTAGPNSYGVYGQTDSLDPAAASVFGYVPGPSFAMASGVAGRTDNAYGVGVLGLNTNQAAGPSINGVAIEGVAASSGSIGVWGIDVSGSGISLVGRANPGGAGVWGDTGSPQSYGVAGTAADGTAAYFENNSPTGYTTLDAVADNASSLSFVASNTQTKSFCYVDSAGSLTCSGAKNAVVPIDGGQRHVALSANESPKNWFEDFGSAQLSAGALVITLEPEFAQTVNTGMEYHVFLTPNGDCKGLYVSQKTPTSFEVHELGGGASSVSFDYRIVALRKNFENIRLADHTRNVAMVKASHVKKAGGEQSTRRDLSKLLSSPKPVPARHSAPQKAK